MSKFKGNILNPNVNNLSLRFYFFECNVIHILLNISHHSYLQF
jgi:hypothetical protein